ncbi:MAG: FecR domain-containing protein [Leptospirales bacterium]|jgi:hypothetical protein
MKKAMVTRKTGLLTALVLSLTVGVAFVNCGEQKPSEAQRSMIIVFASGNAMIVRQGKEVPAKVGMVVNENDVLKTTNGTVDLQTKNGSAVRIRNYTTVTISKLYGEGSADTRLSMEHGGLLASVKRKSGKENFTVTTPTAIAGVRGTTFSVDSNEGEPTRVKVLDGSVAMKPRVAALEKFSAEEIKNDQNLSKLEEIQSKQEVVIEERTQAILDPAVEKEVLALNEKSEAGEFDASQAAELSVAMESTLNKAGDDKKVVQLTKSDVTTEEMAEKATLVTVDDEVANRVREGDDKALEEMRRQRDAKQELVLNQIEEEASRTKLNNEDEIRQHYNKLETLNLRSGQSITGAVIAQTGNVLIVHTKDGVRRLKTNEIEYITYP